MLYVFFLTQTSLTTAHQLRKQLKMTDTWGRNLLVHAVQSGRVHIFEAAFNAMREHLLDPEVCPVILCQMH